MEEAREIENGVIVVIFPDSGERYLSTPLFSQKKSIHLNLYDTLSRKKIPLTPIREDKVCVYTCGPTVHQKLQITQYRRFLFTDLLIRFMECSGYGVEHVVNITDYDDKTIQGAEKAGLSISEFTSPVIEGFLNDLKRLGVRPAQAYPKVSEHLDDMAELAGKLLVQNHAYEKLHSVYFDISSLEGYGALSGVDLNKIRLGATVDLDDYEKNNPRDFTLFKRVGLAELRKGIGMRTQWGNVRPSLHLQCAAMLGEAALPISGCIAPPPSMMGLWHQRLRNPRKPRLCILMTLLPWDGRKKSCVSGCCPAITANPLPCQRQP